MGRLTVDVDRTYRVIGLTAIEFGPSDRRSPYYFFVHADDFIKCLVTSLQASNAPEYTQGLLPSRQRQS